MRYSIIKKIVSYMLIISMCIIPVIPVSAAEASSGEIVVTEEYAKSQSDKLRYGEREVVTVLTTEYRTTTVIPTGQPPAGFRLSSGGSVYVNTSGGPTTSVSFSVSWGAVSAGVSVGLAGIESNIGGLALALPNRNDYFRAKLDKEYKIERHKVDVYQYNEYKYTYYSTPVSLYSIHGYLQKI